MTPADGGAAFPCSPGDVPFWNEGMSLRDWFAGQVLAGRMARNSGYKSWADAAADAYDAADAMLAARQERDQ